MARLYADEDFPLDVVKELRQLGHDVLTTPDAKRAGLGIPDDAQLSFAEVEGRAVLTFNRRDFMRLHRERPDHAGIITCTVDADTIALAKRIDAAVGHQGVLRGVLIRIVRPNPPSTDQSLTAGGSRLYQNSEPHIDKPAEAG